MIDDEARSSEYFKFRGSKEYFNKAYQRYLESCFVNFRQQIHKPINRCEMKDLTMIKFLGSGSFGTVFLVEHNDTKEQHAMKMIRKESVTRLKKIESVKTERQVLHGMVFPFTLHLDYFLQDNSYLYFVVPFAVGGDLFMYIQGLGGLTEEQTRFYSAQAILALEYLHFLGIVYRDLKPENIFVYENGYVKLGDFGTAKFIGSRTWTLCGTPEYIAPEVYLQKGYGKAVDWWALGVLIYEMKNSHSPFQSKNGNMEEVCKNVMSNKVTFNRSVSPQLKDLILHLLQSDLTRRFGNLHKGVLDIKTHSWFINIDWWAVLNQKLEAPMLPQLFDLIEKEETIPDFEISKVDVYHSHFIDF
uniref:Protein kinase domain-containing protein n=1 Tax=Clastoptera arizonana TaxID=38151 RepID=A0A1B6DZS5_9HEMI